MLPLDQGGVVDPNLKVYNLPNVRVVDSSVYPFEFAAHLMAVTYGLAEQAADIIRAQYNGVPSPADLQTETANPATRTAQGPTPTSSATTSSSDASESSAAFKLGSVFEEWTVLMTAVLGVVMTMMGGAVLL
ncbi:hypothetical protein FRC03_012785 [Tulasnella sp. 419]|nr:hypothetical protein FRC03_012785 [Tulasnella sp. 419]